MGSSVRLRIELPDEPGSLAEVANVIGDYGGNITAVDVQQGAGDVAVDEMTIVFADHVDLSRVRLAITSRSGARVLSIQNASPVDLVVRVLHRVAETLDASPEEGDERLRRAVAELCATPAAWVRDAESGAEFAAGRQALTEPGVAAVTVSRERLPSIAETVSGEACLLAVASRRGERRVVIVARPAAQGFTPTEASRVEALVALYDRLVAMRAPTH